VQKLHTSGSGIPGELYLEYTVTFSINSPYWVGYHVEKIYEAVVYSIQVALITYVPVEWEITESGQFWDLGIFNAYFKKPLPGQHEAYENMYYDGPPHQMRFHSPIIPNYIHDFMYDWNTGEYDCCHSGSLQIFGPHYIEYDGHEEQNYGHIDLTWLKERTGLTVDSHLPPTM
jgi:hypothetical protein